VALDTGDNHPVLFWSYVLAALRQPLPGVGERALAALPAGGRAPGWAAGCAGRTGRHTESSSAA